MYQSLSELESGKDGAIIILVKNIETCKASNGSLYQKLAVRDSSGNEMTFMNFNAPVSLSTPAVIQANIRCEEFRQNISVKLTSSAPVNADMRAFFPKRQIVPKDCWNSLVEYLKPLRPGLRKIVSAIIMDHKTDFINLPLNPAGAFSRQCGIMEATWKLVQLADVTAKVQNLDHDLMVSAAMLYYMGKVNTVDSGYNYTKDDILTGCGLQVYNMVQMKVRDLMESDDENTKACLEQKDIDLLCHILVSRFKGTQTAIAEAAAMRYLDEIVTSTDEVNGALLNCPSDSIVINNNSRYNHRLYSR